MNVRFEITMSVAGIALAVYTGCANYDLREPARDGGGRPDAGVWRGDAASEGDARAMPPARDAGVAVPHDAGRRDAGGRASIDAGLAVDAGTDAGIVAPPPPGAVNDYCSGALNITAPGTYSGTTCLGSHDDADPMCGGRPSPDVYYYIDTRAGMIGNVYRLTTDAEFGIGFSPGGCGSFGSCVISSPYSTVVSGGGGVRWYFFVEKLSGGCGDFTLTVEGPDFSG